MCLVIIYMGDAVVRYLAGLLYIKLYVFELISSGTGKFNAGGTLQRNTTNLSLFIMKRRLRGFFPVSR